MSRPIRTVVALTTLAAAVTLTLGGCGGVVEQKDEDRFRAALGNTSLTIFPAYIRDGDAPAYDAAASATIAGFFTANNLAEVTLAGAEVPLPSTTWGMDQSRMYRSSAADLTRYVQQHPISTEFAALPEFLILGTGKVGGVHMYVVDRDGVPCFGMLMNSHHDEFASVNPQTPADCAQVILNRLQDEFSDALPTARDSGQSAQAKSDVRIRSLTVFPVMFANRPFHDATNVIGLMLEKEGLPEITATETLYERPRDRDEQAQFADFGRFVAQHGIDTEHALYAEVNVGDQRNITEVWLLLVARDGAPVWLDHQTPADADFQRVAPRNPMTSCVLIGERLKPHMAFDPALKNQPRAFAALWDEKSGLPDQDERAAIKTRLATLKKTGAAATVTVYPPRVGDTVDRAAGQQLVQRLEDAGLVQATLAETDAHLEVAGNRNEQRVLWDLARALQSHVRQATFDTDYVLYADYMMRPDGPAHAVHFVVCDAAGNWVIVDYQNEYHADFQRIAPKSLNDCNALVTTRVKGYMN